VNADAIWTTPNPFFYREKKNPGFKDRIKQKQQHFRSAI
jgi:hypothetical protein